MPLNENHKYLYSLEKELQKFGVETTFDFKKIVFKTKDKEIAFFLETEEYDPFESAGAILPIDFILTQPNKVIAIILSQLQLNKIIFARNCELKKITKKTANEFLDLYHIMGATQSAYNYGLFYMSDLVSMASFSKGRKMNRLKEHERSFEMIRFCCKMGITVTGGLSKLVKNFSCEKKAGDIMTYVDKNWSNGNSFVNAGFKRHSEKGIHYFLVSKQTFERTLIKDKNQVFDDSKFYLSKGPGNIKLIYKL